LGFTADVALDGVVNMKVHSNRVVYLSSLTPTSERIEGLLHKTAPLAQATGSAGPVATSPWGVRLDRSVFGGPLTIDGTAFEKGLGVHSFTELQYEIGSEYESLVATIGVDDSVRPRGSVVFRVLGDGEVLFDSGVVTGTDAARQMFVDVRSVEILTLIVDYGDDLDLADHADWGGARLLRPREQQATNSP
jgi:hypothetical protein